MRVIGFSTKVLTKSCISSTSHHIINACHSISRSILQLDFFSYINFLNLFPYFKFGDMVLCRNFSHFATEFPSDINYRQLAYPKQKEEKRQIGARAKIFLSDVEVILRRIKPIYNLVDPEKVYSWEVFYDFPHVIATKNTAQKLNSPKALFPFLQEHPTIVFILDFQKWLQARNSIHDLAEVKHRIRAVHLTSLPKEKDLKTINSLPSEIPIIIDSFCKNQAEMQKKFDFISQTLN